MVSFQQSSDWACWATEVWKGNTFKTAFKSKWCGQPKVSKRNTSPTFFELQQSLWMNILPTVFRLKLSGQTKVHKRNTFPQICIPQQSSMKWTFFQQHSKWTVWVTYPNGTLFQKFMAMQRVRKWTVFLPQRSVRIEHSSNSLQIEVIRTA